MVAWFQDYPETEEVNWGLSFSFIDFDDPCPDPDSVTATPD